MVVMTNGSYGGGNQNEDIEEIIVTNGDGDDKVSVHTLNSKEM